MEYRKIDPALPPVSRLSLGSWNTFSRCEPVMLERLLGRALDYGINLLDVGYYWDKPDTEAAVAGALSRLARPRDSYLIAQKLWLWDYPEESFDEQLGKSLQRLGHDYVDMVLVSRPTAGIALETFVEEVVALISSGKARSWGVTNFEPGQLRQAAALCVQRGWPRPALIQMQYNVMRRAIVESEAYDALFRDRIVALCAAHTLEGGILAGHLQRDRVDPPEYAAGQRPLDRNIARDSGGIREEIRRRQPLLEKIASDFGATPAQLAIAFCLSHSAAATALIGATRLENLEENVRAFDLLPRAAEIRAALACLAIDGVAHPKLFNPHNDI